MLIFTCGQVELLLKKIYFSTISLLDEAAYINVQFATLP